MTSPDGTLEVGVEPDTRTFGAKLRAGILGGSGEAEQASEEAGRRSGLAFAAGLGAAAALTAGIKKGLDVSADLEQNQVALTGLLGSGREATAFLGELKEFATGTPFELPGLVDSAQKLLGVGVAAEDVIPTLTAFGDVSAAFGLSQDQLSGVLTAVTQSMAKGRFQAEELMQIQERGIPITQILADAFGVSAGEILKMASAGELTATEVLPVLREQLNQDYGGSLVAQAGTLTGAMSNFKDATNLALAGAVEPLAKALTEYLPQAAEIASNGIGLFGVGLKAAVLIAEPFIAIALDLAEAFTSLPLPVQIATLAFLQLRGGPLAAIRALFGAAKLLSTNFQTASAGAVGLTGNIKAAGAAAKTTAVSVGVGGLTGALKGLAAAAGIGLLVSAFIDIAGNARAARESAEGLLGGLDANDASAVTAAIAAQNEVLEANQAHRDAIGGNTAFSDIFTSSDENIDAATAALDELGVAQERAAANAEILGEKLGISAEAAARLAAEQGIDLVGFVPDADGLVPLDLLGTTANAAADALDAVVEASAQSGAQSAFAEALGVINDELSTAEERANALVDALAALNGDAISVLEAESGVQEALDQLATGLDEAGLAAVDAAGNLDLTSEAGRGVQDDVLGAADAMRQAAQAAYEQAVASGDVAGASAAAGAAAQGVRDDFIGAAIAAGLNADQANALANQYGLIPGAVVTAISQPGMGEAQSNLRIVAAQLSGLPPNTPVNVTALTEEARQRLIDLGITVTTLPDGTVVAYADTAAAAAELNALERPRSTTVTVYTQTRVAAHDGGLFGDGYQMMADGGQIGRRLTPMRAGQAAIVPPNTWKIVVGDRKRDDEFYIPDNGSARSASLAEEWARRNGYVLARAMAHGGFFGNPSRPAPVPSGTGVMTASLLPGAALAVRPDGLFDLVDARVQVIDAGKALARRSGQRVSR